MSVCEQTSEAQFRVSSLQTMCVCVYLDDEGLVLEAWCQAQHAHVGCFVDEVLDAMEDSTTRGRDTSVDSSLADGLSCHARVSVDVLQTNKD